MIHSSGSHVTPIAAEADALRGDAEAVCSTRAGARVCVLDAGGASARFLADVRDVTYDDDRSQIWTGTGFEVMAVLRNAVIGALLAAGLTNIAAANRYHARDSTRPWPHSASADDFAGPWPRRSCSPTWGHRLPPIDRRLRSPGGFVQVRLTRSQRTAGFGHCILRGQGSWQSGDAV